MALARIGCSLCAFCRRPSSTVCLFTNKKSFSSFESLLLHFYREDTICSSLGRFSFYFCRFQCELCCSATRDSKQNISARMDATSTPTITIVWARRVPSHQPKTASHTVANDNARPSFENEHASRGLLTRGRRCRGAAGDTQGGFVSSLTSAAAEPCTPKTQPNARGLGRRRRKNAELWEQRFSELRNFVRDHGNARVPKPYAENPALGRWVSRQREKYKAEIERSAGRSSTCKLGSLSQSQVTRLKSVGFEFVVSRTWQENFALLRKYAASHGDTRVPARYKPDTTLGWWVKNQRQAYKHELLRRQGHKPRCRISTNRIALLDGIAFEWSLPAKPRRGTKK